MTTPEKGRVEYDVSAERFVDVWQRSESVEEVAATLDMPKPIVHARASQYRQMGIKLKQHPRKRRGALDVEALNLLIEQINAETKAGGQEPDARKAGGRAKPELELKPAAVQSIMKDLVATLHKKGRRSPGGD